MKVLNKTIKVRFLYINLNHRDADSLVCHHLVSTYSKPTRFWPHKGRMNADKDPNMTMRDVVPASAHHGLERDNVRDVP